MARLLPSHPRSQARVSAAALVLSLYALGAATSAAAQPQAKRNMTLEDTFRLVVPGAPMVSPDGVWVLYPVTTTQLRENSQRTTHWVVRADAPSTARELLSEGSAPVWSRDSRSIYFFKTVGSGEARGRQLFEQPVEPAGAPAVQRSQLSPQEGGGTWQLSPDGSAFFIARQEGVPEGPGADTDVVFVNEGSNGETRDFWMNFWRFELKTGALTRVTERDWWINSFDISPDGRRLVVSSQPDNGRTTKWRSELFVVDVATGAARQLTRNEVPEANPRWTPDGKAVVFSAARLDRWEYGNGDFWRVDPETGKTVNLTPGHRGRFGTPAFSTDAARIFTMGGEGTARYPVVIDVASRRVTPLLATAGSAAMPSWSDDRRTLAYIYQDFTTPPDLHVLREGHPPVKMTDLNPWVRSEIELGSVEKTAWKSFDQKTVEGLVYLPPGPPSKEPRPLLLHLACGPGCAWINSFSAKAHVYAGLGYVQLSPNMRGASNYDDAWMQAVRFDVGGVDLQDCLTGVDALVARKLADPKKLALDGWSYGGVLGGVMLTRTTRFKAASLGAMVSDWTAEYGTGAVDMERWFIGGNPWTNPKGWRARSSLTRADQVRTPTLLHHGDADDTCSPFQSLNYYAALRRVGTPVRYMRYGNEGHDLRQPKHIYLRDLHDVAWMQRHVNGLKSEQNPD